MSEVVRNLALVVPRAVRDVCGYALMASVFVAAEVLVECDDVLGTAFRGWR
jgi:hypothetical protein